MLVSNRSYYVQRGDDGATFKAVTQAGGVDFPAVAVEPSLALAKGLVAGLPDNGKEHVIVLAMDCHGKPLAWSVVATGTVDSAPLYARDIYGWAVQVPMCRFVGVAHNHPSGVVTPSPADIRGTAGLVMAGSLLALDLAWSLVVTHANEDFAVIPFPEGKGGAKAGDEDSDGSDDQKSKGDGKGDDGEDASTDSDADGSAGNHTDPGTEATPDELKAAVGNLLGKLRGGK